MSRVVLFLLLIASINLYSQSDRQMYSIGGNILVKGKVIDENSLQPVGTDIEFRHSNGKKIKIQSNSISGQWEQILPEGNYTVILYSWNVARKIDEMEVPAATKYKEIQKDFTVKRMLPNDKIFQLSAFDSASENFHGIAKSEIESLKEVMKFNRAVEFTVYVNASDMFAPKPIAEPKPADTKKAKKSKGKSPAAPQAEAKAAPQADYSSLIQKRLAEVESYFSNWGNLQSRIKVEADFSNSKSSYPNSLVVIVSKNQDIFNK